MALTVNVLHREMFGRFYTTLAEVTFDTSYPTGGEVINPQEFGFESFLFVHASTSGSYIPQFDYENNKLIIFDGNYDTEVLDETDLSTLKIRVLAHGH